ncbi:MAG: peroxiredoxin [Planctomycetota bacterium]
MLEIGDKAPDFDLPEGSPAATLHELAKRAGRAVVYFYPADNTPACTAEACMFRDASVELEPAFPDGAPIVGVSPQSESSHKRFAERYRLGFTLIADTDKAVIRAYGCQGLFGLLVRRATFVLDAEATITDRIVADLNVGRHKRAVKSLSRPH